MFVNIINEQFAYQGEEGYRWTLKLASNTILTENPGSMHVIRKVMQTSDYVWLYARNL